MEAQPTPAHRRSDDGDAFLRHEQITREEVDLYSSCRILPFDGARIYLLNNIIDCHCWLVHQLFYVV